MLQKIMSYGFVAFLFVAALALFLHPRLQAEQSSVRVPAVAQANQSHIKWVADSMTKMGTVKVGMTRADLMKVFECDGGMSSAYVYRGCHYFKVDVKFRPVDPVRSAKGYPSDKDVITSISKPYIEPMYID